MRKAAALIVCIAVLFISGCKKEDKAPKVSETREPKTSFGQAVSQARKAAADTENAQKREMEEALGDDDAAGGK